MLSFWTFWLASAQLTAGNKCGELKVIQSMSVVRFCENDDSEYIPTVSKPGEIQTYRISVKLLL